MKFSSVTAAGAVFGLAAATPINKRSSIQKRQVPQEQSHGFILDIANEFMKLENTKNIQDAVFGLLGNAAAEEGAGDVTNLDCLKQETADQAFTNAKAAGDIRGMAGALLFQAIERNTGSVGLASVLCDEPAVNPEIGAITSHQDAASDNALAINKAITLEAARQLASFGADPNLALLSGTFAPGDPNDNTGAGFTCDDVDLELGCIYTEKLLVLDATEDEIASAVADVQQTFTGTGGIFATDLVTLADFDVADVQDEFDLSEIAPGSGGAVATPDAGADATPEAGAGAGETPAVTDECSAIVTKSIAPSSTPAAGGDAEVTGECSLVTLTVGADQTSAVMAQYPSAVLGDVETPTENTAAATATATEAAEDNQGGNQDNQDDNQDGNQNDNQGDNQNDNQDNQNDNVGGGAGGNLQTFAGSLGGAAPEVVNNGDANRPFEVNGAAFDNERSALIRSCDIQNNQCFNAVNGGELAGGTAQCADQLAECQASAGGAPQKRETKRSRILGGVSSKLLGGGAGAGGLGQLLGGGAAAGGGLGQLVGGGAQNINLGTLLGGGNISKLIGGSGLGAILPASKGSQSLVSVVIQQCN